MFFYSIAEMYPLVQVWHLLSCAGMREEYVRYSQYLAATENLKHIFTVPESIEKTQRLIADNNLLYAHQVRSGYSCT